MMSLCNKLGIAATAVLVAACGGGGGGSGGNGSPPVTPSATSLQGVAAAGAPLADALVVLIDSDGNRAVAQVGADGAFRFNDVSAFRPPFVLQALGTVGGKPVALHAPVLSADVAGGVVNVTPMTELMVGTLLGTEPAKAIGSGTSLAPLSTAAVQDAQARVQALVKPVLDTLGAAPDVDLRKTVFIADHTGLDRLLDALKVELTDNGYRISAVAGGTATELAFTSNAAAALGFSSGAATSLSTAIGALADINARLSALSQLFAAGVPTAGSVTALFANGFLHTGLDAAAYAEFLRQPLYTGARFDNPRILQVIDDDTLLVNFRVSFDVSKLTRPIDETMRMRKVNNAWQFAGDGELAAIALSFESRLVATPLSEQALAAMSNVRGQPWTDSNGNAHMFYRRDLRNAAGVVIDTLDLYNPEDYDFGYIGRSNTDTANNSQYYADPNTAIEQFFIPAVMSARVSPLAASIRLTGPGLPAAGLTLVPPKPNRPRDAWVFKGDPFDWTAFNTARCIGVNNAENPVPGCAFDIEQVKTGSEYVFSFFDANGSALGEMRRRLPQKPAAPAVLLQRKDQYFARFQLPANQEFSLRNLFDLQGAFRQGASLVLNWSFPSNPKVRLENMGFATYYTDAQGVARDTNAWRQYPQSARSSQSFTVERGFTFGGAYADVKVLDHFGNSFQHEVNSRNIR